MIKKEDKITFGEDQLSEYEAIYYYGMEGFALSDKEGERFIYFSKTDAKKIRDFIDKHLKE